ncbi:MAG: hypothetical protein IT537_28240, partial [Hyphomicrobiales bacterium]|nr:hypothetical protein [Hyphomicrobiales bacterium]
LEKAQQKVEARNFDIRKNLLKFDNVMNDQRKVIFDQRVEWMREESVNEIISDMRHAAIDDLVGKHVPENAYPEQWGIAGLDHDIRYILTLAPPLDDWAREPGMTARELKDRIAADADRWMTAKDARFGADGMREVHNSFCCMCSTTSGASTWRSWRTCGGSCAGGPSPGVSRWSSSVRTPCTCSRPCCAISQRPSRLCLCGRESRPPRRPDERAPYCPPPGSGLSDEARGQP